MNVWGGSDGRIFRLMETYTIGCSPLIFDDRSAVRMTSVLLECQESFISSDHRNITGETTAPFKVFNKMWRLYCPLDSQLTLFKTFAIFFHLKTHPLHVTTATTASAGNVFALLVCVCHRGKTPVVIWTATVFHADRFYWTTWNSCVVLVPWTKWILLQDNRWNLPNMS